MHKGNPLKFSQRMPHVVILALSKGHTCALGANILSIDADTVRRYLRLYEEKGLAGLLANHYKGRA
jgi:transposase